MITETLLFQKPKKRRYEALKKTRNFSFLLCIIKSKGKMEGRQRNDKK